MTADTTSAQSRAVTNRGNTGLHPEQWCPWTEETEEAYKLLLTD